jgi:hypothetical protein
LSTIYGHFARSVRHFAMSLAGEDHAFLNVTWMRGDSHVWHPQERVRRHIVDLNAIASLVFGVRDDALQRRMDHFRPIKAEGRRPDRAGHIEEGPSGDGKLLFEFGRREIVRYRHPCIRIRIIPKLKTLWAQSVLFDQNGSGVDFHVLPWMHEPHQCWLAPSSFWQLRQYFGHKRACSDDPGPRCRRRFRGCCETYLVSH